MDLDFVRYLAAKKTVDDRALNRNVWEAFVHALPPQAPTRPVRVLEIGAGIGTMLERLVEKQVLMDATYTALDAEATQIAELKRRCATLPGIHLEACVGDVFDFCARRRGAQKWDVLIASAVLDLLDVPRVLPQLFALLEQGGLFYFPINFDGATIFEPVIDPAFDALIEQVYHRTMDKRVTNGMRSGDSRTGRHLFRWLRECGAEIIAAGSSDWVVFAGAHGYPHEEAYFLHFIIETVRAALESCEEVDAQRLREWVACRHQQIEEGKLVYIAHQIDLVGRVI